MRIITSATVFNDAVGMRMSVTYSEIDDETGRIVSDNQRYDRVITDANVKKKAQALMDYAAESLVPSD